MANNVGIIMGSQSDWPTMKEAALLLDQLGIPYEAKIVSAHRTPDRLWTYGKTAVDRGLKVIIAGAGGAALTAGPPTGLAAGAMAPSALAGAIPGVAGAAGAAGAVASGVVAGAASCASAATGRPASTVQPRRAAAKCDAVLLCALIIR